MEYAHRTTRYRLLPRTRAKHQKLMQVTGACIWVWNRMLAWNEEEYAWHERIPWVLPKPSTRFESTGKVFTQLRAKTDWLQVLPFGAIRHALKDQALAWERCFKHQAGRPQYKSKYRTRTVTFPEPGHFKLAGQYIRLQKLGWFRLARRGNDPYRDHEARSVTIKRECGRCAGHSDIKAEQRRSGSRGTRAH